ncbi:hypothetical protein GCM10010339_25480 [Streptomyces alanosinicus]|uniref:Uncharacterized protein n=1 Tax=Streptomyces alanosinicus TaxID=68171 RepID=A0A919D350_9ACTN|nr:hypothetical protein GCM10010339_25480 [Streptomyces alanosinicus]
MRLVKVSPLPLPVPVPVPPVFEEPESWETALWLGEEEPFASEEPLSPRRQLMRSDQHSARTRL